MMSRIAALTVAGFIAGLVLAACAGTEEKGSKNVLTLDEVDVISPGVIQLVTSAGSVSLDDPRIACRKMRKSGTNMITMVCMTREEKAIMADSAEQELALIQEQWERQYDVYRNAR